MSELVKVHVDSDREFVQRARAGSADAFAELVRAHQMTVRWFLSRYVGDAATVDDLAQEVFLDAIKNMSQLENDSSFRSWLVSIARNKAVSYLRSQRRKIAEVALDPQLPLISEKLRRASNSGPFASDHREMLSVLNDCLSKLNLQSQQLLKSYYFDNRTAESIAQEGDRNSSAVRMALLRIRQTLAKCMRRQLGEEFDL